MKELRKKKAILCLLLAFALTSMLLCACGGSDDRDARTDGEDQDTSRYLVAIEDEPDTVDFQCTTIFYTIATNVFNRLVEMETTEKGNIEILPSLAETWTISDDGRSYTFHLRENVKFSNGSDLTSSDVLYSFKRLLTHPNACNQEIAETIVGADRLMSGKSDELEGFVIHNDHEFTVTLEQPFAAFLACISMPAGSILDEQTTEKAGDRFGQDPESTIGTGSYILRKWEPGEGMLLSANENCWEGPPDNEGLDLRFLTEQEDIQKMFEGGKLDILDLDDVGNSAEFFLHGDIYQDRIHEVPRIAITYIAMNESIEPLDQTEVRKALQLSLNRKILLDSIYDGYGKVENGIFPHGLYGFNPKLKTIPYDPQEARDLLAKAGYPDGFDLTISVKSSSTSWEMKLMELVASMWEEIGVHACVDVITEDTFMKQRKEGKLACYTAMWTADYDDPDNFIYTFFGGRGKTTFRSLCYPREDIMKRVRQARMIMDPDQRLKEYHKLEKIIVQEDAAWIPLFSRLHHYVTSERVEHFTHSWNGSVKNEYRYFSIKEPK